MKKNERGIATIESVLLLSIFVVFMTYAIGMFGVIHTGILNSISARAYAFETFRNRANVNYFRDTESDPEHLDKFGFRAHGVTAEGNDGDIHWNVTTRAIAKGREVATQKSRPTGDQAGNLYDGKREPGSVNPVWVKTVYGLCLSASCGSQGGS